MKQVLQYLWIEKYRCIEKQGFNFTRRVTVQFDYEAKKLTIENNEDYCEDFFDDSIELSCIVGKNGVGKTTILRVIKEIFSKKSEMEYLVIIYNGSGYEICHFLKDCKGELVKHIEIKNDIFKIDINQQVCDRLDYYFKKPDCLYYTEHLSPAQYTFPDGDNELSTSHKLWNIHSLYSEETGDHINRFFLNEFENQMNLIIKYGKMLDNFKIKYPPYVIATLKCDKRIFDVFVKKCNEILEWEGTLNDLYWRLFPINNLVSNSNDDKMIKFKDKMAEAIFLNIIYTLQHHVNGLTKENYKSFSEIIEKYANSTNGLTGWRFLKSFLKSISNEFYIFRLEEYISFMDYIDQIKVSPNVNALSGFGFDNSFIIPTIKESNIDQVDFLNDIKEFFEKYYPTAEFSSYINFSWGLSSGETSLLNIFSRLYSSECKKESKNEVALFLLDEIDVTLHPEWQRNIINELLKFIKYTFKDKYIQVIMTTHSPIMLSDVPKQNVVYISSNNAREEYKKQPETFGSNIFKLYNNAFFLDNGAIGQLAKEKLEKLLEEILAGNGNENDIQKRINMIGDDFLKKQFQSQFESTYNKKDIVDEEKEKLKAKIKELEEEIAVLKNQNK